MQRKLQKLHTKMVQPYVKKRLTLGLVSAEDFDKWVRPEDMVGSLK